MLESYIKKQRQKKDILLMTHIVVGYPSIEDCEKIVDEMVASGVDIMELQIPFSEPIADGPVILKANQVALENGITVADCFDFARRMNQKHNIPFLYMTYANILYKYGIDKFVYQMVQDNIYGSIIPDLPPEEGMDYIGAMKTNNRSPIFIFAPTTSDERMSMLANHGSGFIYCVARKGVTGSDTNFSKDLDNYLSRCRKSTNLPIALGFGVKDRTDIDFLTNKVDIAVIGTQTIKVVETQGVDAVGDYINSLR
ncbi:tryptophan synthase subunit alpha [Candidatus Magnetomorum sp. HK-1]|nr:tryptophan synthase subunit alpha [Candidatus Magnetomorum sp. HK-1]